MGGGVFFFIFLCILLSMKYTYIIISIDPRTAIRIRISRIILRYFINPIDDNIDLGFRMINDSYIDIDTIYITHTLCIYIYICSYIFKSKNRCSNHILHTIYLLWWYYKYINMSGGRVKASYIKDMTIHQTKCSIKRTSSKCRSAKLRHGGAISLYIQK